MAARDEKPESHRADTDKSLHDERTKTDAYLERRQKEVEQRTTDAIEDDRRMADERRTLDRSARDQHVTEGHEQATHGDESLVRVERELSDQAIYQERELEDSNLRRERREKQLLVEALLSIERQRTDVSLSHERECVDLASQSAIRHLAEEQARHTSTREELSDRELAVGTICHDLKNQNVAISMGFQLLRKVLSREAWDRAEITRQITTLEDNTAFMGRMIDSMLDIERFAHGKLTLNLAPADLCEVLQDTVKLFSPVAITKSCSLGTDLGPEPLWVSVDHDRLVQVVANLVGNAIKFTPSGGTISLTAKQEHTRVTVSVTDTGIGIAEQARSKLFQKFSQLDHAEAGLGLGLYVAKSIVEAHGGTIWVDSTVGQGSSFRFTLPLAAAQPALAKDEAGTRSYGQVNE
jgi:signal transduction histidine kinase